jgi:hypothetical protein
MSKWDTSKRFDNAREWILASGLSNGIRGGLDPAVLDTMADCCVKRHGVWSLRKTAPKDTRRFLVWKAFNIARHSAQWGNLAPWNETLTAELVRANDDDRALFNRAFDQFAESAAQIQKKKRG